MSACMCNHMHIIEYILRMGIIEHWRWLAEVLSPHAYTLIHDSALKRTLATPPPKHLAFFAPASQQTPARW